jgi:uncharacterized membrane protein YgcG
MEQHEESGAFAPDQHQHSLQAQATTISSARRRWRAPAVATTTALVAAICLYTGSAAHPAATPAAAGVSAASVQHVAAGSALSAHAAAQPLTTGYGGVHGAFNVYDGAGGGIEFWFDPNTGALTVAVGSGVGIGASGVLGTYAPGTEPAAGTYLYASATLAAGTVASENVSGSYSLTNGVFSGSVSATVEGRTVTLTSDGVSGFNASVLAGSGAAGWTASTGIKFVFDFNISDVLDYIWNAIENFFTGQYSLTDSDETGDATTAYSDASGTDGSVVSSDGSTDDSSTSGDDGTSSDSGDSGDSGGDSGGGGGGGSGDDSDAPIMEESFSHALLPDSASTTPDTSAASSAK